MPVQPFLPLPFSDLLKSGGKRIALIRIQGGFEFRRYLFSRDTIIHKMATQKPTHALIV